MDRSLPAMEITGRGARLQDRLAQAGVDVLLVTNLTNVRYLTGFTGSAGRVLVTTDRLVLFTDARYGEQAEAQLAAAGVAADLEVGGAEGQTDSLTGRLRSGPTGLRIGLEASSVTWAAQRNYAELAATVGGGLVATTSLVEDLRRVKDAGEVARIEAAAAIADAALAQVRHRLADGPTEAEFGLELDTAMRRMGADDVSFETIVASGPNGSRPHHRPSTRRISPGDLVVLDFGALVDGYHSDMTRSFVIGDPTAEQRDLYDLLLAVQLAGIAAVRAGTGAKDVDAACRTAVADAGYLDWYLHSTGHGVGLLIHEDPFESPTSTLTLRVGDVVTVEPGLYRVGFGGYRIEDLVEVTDVGCRTLTAFPKDSPCLPSPPTT